MAFLCALVDAHDVPDERSGTRRPIYVFYTLGGSSLDHHALPDPPPAFDDAVIAHLDNHGLIDVEYTSSGHDVKLTPTERGRAAVEAYRRVEDTEPIADVKPIVAAIEGQAGSDNPLAWPAVRPVLAALNRYWQEGGFGAHGVQLRPIYEAVPETREGLFVATIQALLAGDYLDAPSGLTMNGIPGEVVLTDRARAVLDGWPGADPDELFDNLVAVLVAAIDAEPDPARRGRLEKMLHVVRDVGVSTAGRVLADVLVGGATSV
jgi:hypothetical protein